MSDAKPVRTVGICGLGQMGTSAAVTFARAGYHVLLWGRPGNDPARFTAIRAKLAELRSFLHQHAGPPAALEPEIKLTPDLTDLDAHADLIVEAIAENIDAKVEILRQFPRALQRGALLVSTTSGLSITEMGRRAGCSPRFAGAHFWNPPHLMPIVEVVRGADTPDAVMDEVCALMVAIGKIPVRVNKDVPGFIGNRLQSALWREAIHLVQSGVASAADVDRVARLTFGLRLPAVGPLENMDLIGLDLVHDIHSYLLRDLAADAQPVKLLAQHVHAGDLGTKSGRGFYDWTQRDAKALVARRDRQIVQQLAHLKAEGAL